MKTELIIETDIIYYTIVTDKPFDLIDELKTFYIILYYIS